jgi:seryl-tRNA synthetase
VTAAGADHRAPALHFPLVMERDLLAQTSYLRSFPDLAGAIQSYSGGEARFAHLLQLLDDGAEWSAEFSTTDLGLCSAACHPLYPTIRGRLPDGGRRFEVFGNCFRHEPSRDPARMQVFRQHEFVYVGEPELATAHRDRWVERALDLHSSLGLKVEAVVANDPFFGRAGEMLAVNQIAEALKIEIVSPICSTESPTAISSANCHRDHFGSAFGIETADGTEAHSACVGFGVERITLALLHTHGPDPAAWAPGVRSRLGL